MGSPRLRERDSKAVRQARRRSGKVSRLENLADLLQLDRLGQEEVDAALEGLLLHARRGQSRESDDGGGRQVVLGLELADLARGLQAVEARHVDVHEDAVEVAGRLAEAVDGQLAVLGRRVAPP